ERLWKHVLCHHSICIEEYDEGNEQKRGLQNIRRRLRSGTDDGNVYTISMINLEKRSYQKELMDRDDIPFPAMAQTLRELNTINTRLGGHAITIRGLKQLIENLPLASIGVPISVCEIGCGGGDNLFVIHKHCLKKNIPVNFIGIDMNPECI